MAVVFLTVDDVLALHADQIERFGGRAGIRDIGLLESDLGMPLATFQSESLHPSLAEMAAAYLFHIARNHPFLDGNKRVGLMAMLVFVALNRRLAVSFYSLAFYLWKTLVPLDLSPIYELPERIDPFAWPYPLAATLVAAVTAAAVALRRRWPALLAVWVSYIVILLPVVGIVQNGPQIAADRYTYLATLGWAVLVGGGVRQWSSARGREWAKP